VSDTTASEGFEGFTELEPQPFTPSFDPATLDDLRARLRSARWPDIVGADDWRYGVPQEWLRDMVAWWADSWDADAAVAAMNRWEHHRVVIDGVLIHYVRAPGVGPNPKPLILTHGWPWTFWDFKDVIGPLSDPGAHGGDPADAYDVIVPSLPGFGFSTPLRAAGIGVPQVAERWVRLMREVLGYDTFCAHGGDWGAIVTSWLAHAHAEHIIGAHMSLPVVPGVNRRELGDRWADDEAWMPVRMAEVEPLIRSHVTVHTLDPQTLAYGLVDSPVGTAAWLWERRRNWSDCDGDVESVFSRDHLCTTAALYWCNGSIGSSLRLYHEHFGNPPGIAHDRMPRMEAPCAFAIFPKELVLLPRSVAAEYSDLRRWTLMEAGGHFAAPEQPALLVDDLRAFFGGL
jgi:pimeloyl-ACP methyl ester carboxylesterase